MAMEPVLQVKVNVRRVQWGTIVLVTDIEPSVNLADMELKPN